MVDLAGTEEAKRQADEERWQEELRLLYVALTRARHACWLGIAPVKVGQAADCQIHRSAVGYVLTGGNSIRAGEIEERLRQLGGECQSITVRPLPEANPSCYEPPAETGGLEPARRFESPPRNAGGSPATAHYVETWPKPLWKRTPQNRGRCVFSRTARCGRKRRGRPIWRKQRIGNIPPRRTVRLGTGSLAVHGRGSSCTGCWNGRPEPGSRASVGIGDYGRMPWLVAAVDAVWKEGANP